MQRDSTQSADALLCQEVRCVPLPATAQVRYGKHVHRVCPRHFEAVVAGKAVTLTEDGKSGCIGYAVNVLVPVIPQTGDQERLAI